MTTRSVRPAGLVVLSEGFRVFFLSAALFAIFSMVVWIGWLGIHAAGGVLTYVPFSTPPHHWHAHELVFGYGGAVLAGFFLTALPSWTGALPSRAAFITAITAVWLSGRIAVFFSSEISPTIVAVVDLAFVPVLSIKILANLLKRPKPQNLMFLGILALLFAGNAAVHLEWVGLMQDTASAGLVSGLLTLSALIAVLGGRVTPAFTRNAMRASGVEAGLPASHALADGIGIVSAIGLALFALVDADARLLAVIAAVAAIANGIRLSRWRSLAVLNRPILWSLHLGFAMLVLGYGILAFHWAGFGIGRAAAFHILGIGAVGGMTLAVMSRAALGHTGRPLVVAPQIAFAYVLMALAALVRSLGVMMFPGAYYTVIFTAGGLWIAAFVMFLVVYGPILSAPKVDGGS